MIGLGMHAPGVPLPLLLALFMVGGSAVLLLLQLVEGAVCAVLMCFAERPERLKGSHPLV